MDKTSLVDLKRKMFIRSSLLALNSLDDILSLNDYLSPDEILLEIIKKALREFELTNPLILDMKMNKGAMATCYGREGWYEIKPNFNLYLDCIIGEDQIVLSPLSRPKWQLAGIYTGDGSQGWSWVSGYERPYVYLGDLINVSDMFYLRGICARPIIPDFLPDKTFNPGSEKACVYWMDVEQGAKGNYFIDLCMVHLLDYIRQLKASVMLPTMSVDVMANVDPAFQELRARCDQFAIQSGWYGNLIE